SVACNYYDVSFVDKHAISPSEKLPDSRQIRLRRNANRLTCRLKRTGNRIFLMFFAEYPNLQQANRISVDGL
ncbi:MAG: hypothetical protein J7L99_05090, partial [Planctomycetes bacterium]|nr:hypothetical protein [Planctomycetota bacterium]